MTEPQKTTERIVLFPEGNKYLYTKDGEIREGIPPDIMFTVTRWPEYYELFAPEAGTLLTVDYIVVGYIDGYCASEGRGKTRHDGDCTIYAALEGTDDPRAGICTCGYGWDLARRQGDFSQLFSQVWQDRQELTYAEDHLPSIMRADKEKQD